MSAEPKKHGLSVAAAIVRDLAETKLHDTRDIRLLIERAQEWMFRKPDEIRTARDIYIVGFSGINIGASIAVHKKFVADYNEAVEVATTILKNTKIDERFAKATWVLTPDGEAIDL